MTVNRSFEEELRVRLGDLAEPTPAMPSAVLPAVRARVARHRRRRTAGLATAVIALLVGGAWGVVHPLGGVHQPAVTAESPRPYAVSPMPAQPPLGAVIPARKADGGEERVFYAVAVADPALPDVHFGIMAGRRDASGRLFGDVLTNEVVGSDRSPGFHSVWEAAVVNGRRVPMFGYFVGPAAQIVATSGSRRVQADLATWSEDQRVVVFWFDLADVPPGSEVDDLAALDRAGRKL